MVCILHTDRHRSVLSSVFGPCFWTPFLLGHLLLLCFCQRLCTACLNAPDSKICDAAQSDAGYYPSTQDQDRILDEARRSVKKASFFMKKSLVICGQYLRVDLYSIYRLFRLYCYSYARELYSRVVDWQLHN